MGKSDEKQTEKRAHKAMPTDAESKHNKQTSFATFRSNSPFETTYENTDAELRRHSQWRDLFQQLCEYKVRLVPIDKFVIIDRL